MSLESIEKLSATTNFISYYLDKFNVILPMNESKIDIWSAYKLAKDKRLSYLDRSLGVLSSRKAALYIDNRLDQNALIKKANDGFLSRDEDKKFYIQELNFIKYLFEIQENFIQERIIVPTQDLSGRKIWAIIPAEMQRLGRSATDQKLNSLGTLMSHPLFTEFLNQIQIQKEN